MNRETLTKKGSSILFLFLAMVLANMWVGSLFIQWDLTKDRKYSLSQSTKELLSSLNEKVTITAYFSRSINAEVGEKVRYIESFLNEIESCSTGKVEIQYIDPANLGPDKIEKLEKEGVRPLTVKVRNNDKYEATKCYLGLVLRSADHKEIIPAMVDDRRMEYDLYIKIASVSEHKKGKIGLLINKNIEEAEESDYPQYSFEKFKRALRKVYNVEEISEKSTSSHYNALIVIGGGDDLSDEGISILDNQLIRGGSAVLLMDNWMVDIHNNRQKPVNAGLKSFLQFHNIHLNKYLIYDVLNARVELKTWLSSVVVNHPYFLVVNSFDRGNKIIGSINSAILPFPSSIEYRGENLKYSPLIFSSNESFLYTPVNLDPTRMSEVPAGAQKGPFTLGAQFNGDFISYYGGEEKESNEGNLILLSGVGGLDDEYFDNNSSLFLNVINGLLEDWDLLSIRDKNVDFPPLMILSSFSKKMVKYFNVFFMAMIITVLWIYRFMIRRKEEYQKYIFDKKVESTT